MFKDRKFWIQCVYNENTSGIFLELDKLILAICMERTKNGLQILKKGTCTNR